MSNNYDEHTKTQLNQQRRLRNVLAGGTVTAVLLVAATYAWFVGNQEVKVNPFEVKIASTDSLQISLNGHFWAEEMTISREHVLGISEDTTGTIPSAGSTDKNVKMNAFAGNTNNWPEKGLVPISTSGQMDSSVSRLMLYEKTSLITTAGGYRVLSNRIKNNVKDNFELAATSDTLTTAERYDIEKGYIAFDLFVKNYTGGTYNAKPTLEQEEDIYLTKDSEVKVHNAGYNGTDNLTPSAASLGLSKVDVAFENGVRVAFAQVGRTTSFGMGNSVSMPATGEDVLEKEVQGLNCASGGTTYGASTIPTGSYIKNPYLQPNYDNIGTSNAVGICRVDNIWEPNETKHTTDAQNYFTTSCKQRVGSNKNNTFEENAYNDTACTPQTLNELGEETSVGSGSWDGKYINTYVFNDEFKSGTATGSETPTGNHKVDVDIFDGHNNYKTSIDKDKSLVRYKYFTDADKLKENTDRQPFMKLASNSITKVRVYIYLEGQDIDNFYHGGLKDLGDNNAKINVNFGFTKSRF